MHPRSTLLFVIVLASPLLIHAGDLKPVMVQLDELVLNESFEQSRKPDKQHWKPRQHTRWTQEDGVLRGIPSTADFQASQDHHQGLEPRISIPSCPQEFAIEFSFRFIGGKGTALCPFVEFGHHVGRIYWHEEGAQLLANKESIQLDSNPNFIIEDGRWYTGLAEVKGDAILISFEHGPVFYGKHPSLDTKRDGFGIAGPRGSTVELDNIRVWSVKNDPHPDWPDLLRRFQLSPHKILKPEIAQQQ